MADIVSRKLRNDYHALMNVHRKLRFYGALILTYPVSVQS